MALSRSRRSNAGSKMASLLNSMEADEFYTSTYGGFEEDEVDAEFICDAVPVTEDALADADDDIVDSDFSIDENDEPRSDIEDADNPDKPKRAKRALGVQTKAYKEPRRDKTPKIKKPLPSEHSNSHQPEKVTIVPRVEVGRKLTRASTVSKTVETVKRQKERALKKKKLLKKKLAQKKLGGDRELTQEELLEEAKETELLNIESLKKFQQMEIEAKQKAIKALKRSVQGPCITFLSTAMPLPKTFSSNKENAGDDKIDIDGLGDKLDDNLNAVEAEVDDAPHERTFVTFSDFETFRKNFPERKLRESHQKICPITRLPAKYFDPVTRLPYANVQAYRILREAYYNQLELKGDRSDPEVAAWLEWRQKNKPAKPPIITQVPRPPPAYSHLLATAQPVGSPNRLTVSSASPATPTTIVGTHLASRQATPTLVMTATAPAAVLQTSRNLVAVQPQQQQQSVVLPVRTTPLTQTVPVSVSQLLQTSQTQLAQGTLAGQPSATVQTVKIGGQPTQLNVAGTTRTVTASLTRAQLQQLAAGNRASLGTINFVRASGITTAGQRAQLSTRSPVATTVSPSGMIRPQTISGQVSLQQPQARAQTIAIQRPGMTAQTIALQPAAMRPSGQLIVAPGGTSGTRQQIVVASSGQHGGVTRQIVMTSQGGGTPIRSGQILQLTGQGGQQHQIVVSQSGQLILSPQTKQQQQH